MFNFCKIFLAAVIVTASAFAQDIITMQDGSEVQAVVVDVGVDEIRYKKYNFQEGPYFIVGVSKVFSIRYRNGEKEVFEKKESPSTAAQQPLYLPFYVPQYGAPAPTASAALPRLPLKPDVSDVSIGRGKIVWGHILLWNGIIGLGLGIPLTAASSDEFATFIFQGGVSLAFGIPLLASGKKERRQYESGYGALMPDRLQISPQKVEFVWAF